jgi:SprT-like family
VLTANLSDEPKSARKPLPKHMLPGPPSTASVPSTPSMASRISAIPDHLKEASATPSTSTASTTPKKPRTGAPRTSKKKAREEEQARLRQEADILFKELNRTIFAGGLPEETKLNWNKRLLTTAGRAKWHRYARSRGTPPRGLTPPQVSRGCSDLRNRTCREDSHILRSENRFRVEEWDSDLPQKEYVTPCPMKCAISPLGSLTKRSRRDMASFGKLGELSDIPATLRLNGLKDEEGYEQIS